MTRRRNYARDLDLQALDSILRTDFLSFVQRCFQHLNPGTLFLPNWHIEAINCDLQMIQDGDITRLIINVAPRTLKSLIVSVAFPAFLLGHDPGRRIICISYNTELAIKHSSDFRSIVESDWYKRVFPNMRLARTTDSEIHTRARGFRKATSIDSTLTGLGGDLFIIDDPQKPADAQSEPKRNSDIRWFSNTLISRLDNKRTSAIIIVTQRVHQQDLSGYLTEQTDDWKVLRLAAIAEVDEEVPIGPNRFHRRRAGEALHPAHEPLAVLEGLRRLMSPDDFAAQYQQRPVPPEGGMIKRPWLRFYDHALDRAYATKVILSIDTASKLGPQNDWSAGVVFYVIDDKYYLVDMFHERLEYPFLRSKVLSFAERYDPTSILIEDTGVGTGLGQEFGKYERYDVELIKPKGSKVERLYVQQDKFYSGMVLFPENAPFTDDVITELLTFPHGKHDDIVDAISQALEFRGYGYDRLLRGFQD